MDLHLILPGESRRKVLMTRIVGESTPFHIKRSCGQDLGLNSVSERLSILLPTDLITFSTYPQTFDLATKMHKWKISLADQHVVFWKRFFGLSGDWQSCVVNMLFSDVQISLRILRVTPKMVFLFHAAIQTCPSGQPLK